MTVSGKLNIRFSGSMPFKAFFVNEDGGTFPIL
jgi:hypothetical protein